jgi:ABC-type ATPase involved in cell division
MDVKEGFVQSVYGFNGTAYSIVFCADETIRASLTVDLSSLGREERLPPLEAELLITRELGRIFVNSEETAYNDLPRNLKDVIDDYLVKKEHATVTVVQEEGQFDTITWSANMKSIPWTAAKITIYWNKAADHITLPENHLTVLENAAYPLYIRCFSRRKAKALAKEMLLKVGLTEDQFKRMPNMLSGGEQQRVAIARTLVSGNEIVLADEPTGNLDSENSQNIVKILQQLAHEENRCVIIVTHDPAVAEAADIAIRMKDGKLLENT